MKSRLILMLKYPLPGTVKTRLVPALGERRACEVYRALVRHTLDEAQRFASKSSAAMVARVANAPNDDAVRRWLGDGFCFQPQGDGTLGRRMERAVRDAFAERASSVVVIGADCPGLAVDHLDAAFRALESKEAVFGPAIDGGYYLIGLRRFQPALFRGIHWSTESVLEETLTAAVRAGVEYELLDTLHDLDVPEDLPLWAQSRPAQLAGKSKVSVIIPTLNEAADLPRVLKALQRGQPHELIVVDGGSTDETVNVARTMDAIVLNAPRCRATQINCGAAVATGEFLLFLHADTLLPSDYSSRMLSLLDQPGVVGGAFKFAVADSFPGRRLVESTTNWRTRRWQMPYGDQGLFLRREAFLQLGGFREIPIMEDYEFVRRLRRLGRISIAMSPAVTSGRRWRRLGVVRTTLINKAIILAYHLGVSPARLAAWYRGRSARAETSHPVGTVRPQPVEVRIV